MAKIDLIALGLKKQYTFDMLVVGPHNQMAAAASLEVAKNLGDAYNPLFLFGPPGIGKTHVMQALAHAALALNPELKVKYLSAERFVNEIITAISSDTIVAVRQQYSDLDVLIIDDVQYLLESKITQNEFLHIFNALHEKNRQVVLAADRSPGQLTGFEKTIRSRLEWGLAADIKLPDLPTRVEILRLKQKGFGISLSDEVMQYIAERLESSVRELEGFLKRLHAYMTFSHQELTMELIAHVLVEILPQSSGAVSPEASAPAPAAPNASSGAAPHVSQELKKNFVPPAPAQEKPALPPQMAPPPGVSKIPGLEGSHVKSNGNGAEPSVPPPLVPPVVREAAPPPPPPPVKKEPIIAPVVSGSLTGSVSGHSPVKHEAPPSPPPAMHESEVGDLPSGHKEVVAVFFYPAGAEKQLESVIQKFQEVIKKHKLKFRLKRIANHPYDYRMKLNYSAFVDVCKHYKVPVAIVIGPPSDSAVSEHEFHDMLAVTLDVQGISLQLVNWSEIEKDYRYLNLALDIALIRTR